MKFLHWFTKTVLITRLQTVSGDTAAFSTVTSTKGQIQPLSPSDTQILGGKMGKTHRIWVDSAVDIQEGDKLKDEDGKIYRVKKGGVSARAMGSIDYKEVLIEEV